MIGATLFELNHPEIPDSSTGPNLDEVPERSLLIASGRFFYVSTYTETLPARSSGSFERYTIRPIPATPGDLERRFEVLMMGASRGDRFMVTTPEHVSDAELVWREA